MFHSPQPGQHEKHEIVLTMPEETLTLVAPTAEAKSEWSSALQRSILDALRADQGGGGKDGKLMSFTTPPITRKTSFVFQVNFHFLLISVFLL